MPYEKFYMELDEYIDSLEDKKNDYRILSFVKERLGEIPEDIKNHIAERIGVLPMTLDNTIKFYPKLQNRRKKKVLVCMGGGCHRDSKKFYNDLVKVAKDNPDWEIGTVRCFGRCGDHPVVSIDGDIIHKVNLPLVLKKMDLNKK